MARSKKNRISVWNWMGTLLLCAIPGVNLIAVICFMIWGKASSKKSFALALLLWWILLIIAAVAVMVALPDQMTELANWLREQSAAIPAAPLP